MGEIAWETFEYARVIIEDYLAIKGNENDDEYIRLLSLVHSFLGEIFIEDENNELALIEFRKSLELQNKCKIGVIKCRQKAFNHFMASLAAQFSGKNDDALKHCNIALKGLSERIMDLLKGFECNDECKENDNYGEIIKIAEGFMDKMDEDKAKSDDRKELKALIGVMGDLMSKLEEVEEIIKNPIAPPVDDGNSNNNKEEY